MTYNSDLTTAHLVLPDSFPQVFPLRGVVVVPVILVSLAGLPRHPRPAGLGTRVAGGRGEGGQRPPVLVAVN